MSEATTGKPWAIASSTTLGRPRSTLAKSSVFGALYLYQDFVGIFMNLLSFMGDRE